MNFTGKQFASLHPQFPVPTLETKLDTLEALSLKRGDSSLNGSSHAVESWEMPGIAGLRFGFPGQLSSS